MEKQRVLSSQLLVKSRVFEVALDGDLLSWRELVRRTRISGGARDALRAGECKQSPRPTGVPLSLRMRSSAACSQPPQPRFRYRYRYRQSPVPLIVLRALGVSARKIFLTI